LSNLSFDDEATHYSDRPLVLDRSSSRINDSFVF
jgi:hypothetical protein